MMFFSSHLDLSRLPSFAQAKPISLSFNFSLNRITTTIHVSIVSSTLMCLARKWHSIYVDETGIE